MFERLFRLQEHGTTVRTELVAGHGGVSGRYQAWRDLAFELAWIIDQVAPERAE